MNGLIQSFPLARIFSLLTASERRSATFLLVLMLIGMSLETLGVGMVVPAIALMTQPELPSAYPQLQPLLDDLGNPDQARLVTGAMLVLVAVYLLKFLFLGYLAWRQGRFVYSLGAQLSHRLFSAYLHQPYTFHLQRNSAQLVRNATHEVSIFTGYCVTPAMLMVTEGLAVLGVVILLLVVEPAGAVTLACVISVAGWLFYRSTRMRVANWGDARQHHEGQRFQHLQQGLGGVKEVRLLGRESDFIEQFRYHTDASARVGRFQDTLQQLPRLGLELLAVLGLAVLVLAMQYQGREIAAIVPMLGLFAAAAFRLLPSVNRILGAMQSLRYGEPVIGTLKEELDLAVPDPPARRTAARPFRDAIQLDHVGYTYASAATPALTDLSVRIGRGECVGFIGPSGAGKSTLVDVILGLLPPSSGMVMVDGQDIHADLRAWQDQIGYVPQSIFLTDDTLRRNVGFGLPNEQIDDEALMRSIRAAQLEEFCDSLPLGLETIVGERGVRLSGGQRQRIGIARALYHDPAVLVLDEATSALDTDTESEVMRAVSKLQGSKTILIVAHRLSTVDQCDRLYRLDMGRLSATGPVDARKGV